MTATKTKPTKTREEELLAELEEHRAQMATLERQASELDHAAAELDTRAEAKVLNLDGSLTDLPKSIDDDRGLALLKRQRAADLRRRAQAYAAKVELPAIAAEHDQLRQERIAQEQLEAATKEAKALIEEAEIRAAWLFRSHIQTVAVRARYLELTQRLSALESQQHLGIDVGRFTTLGIEAQKLASRYVQELAGAVDEDLWRDNLPELETLGLPAELFAPVDAWHPQSDQRTGKPVHLDTGNVDGGIPELDRRLPKDHAMRLAAGAVPSPRNPDGTLIGSVTSPFGGNAGDSGTPRPRTEAEDRAKRKQIGAEVAAEDERLAAARDGG